MDTFFKVWAAVGPLFGIFVGSYLTRRWQREQWLKDNKKQEYRELIDAISKAYMNLLIMHATTVAMDARYKADLREAENESFRVLRNRLFVAEEIKEAGILTLWVDATRAVDHDTDIQKFSTRFEEVRQKIVDLAMKLKD